MRYVFAFLVRFSVATKGSAFWILQLHTIEKESSHRFWWELSC